MNRFTRSTITAVLAAGIIFGGGAIANAGNSWQGYDTIVGRLNGSGFTSTQTKAASDRRSNVDVRTVGGSYAVDFRAQRSDGARSSSWVRNVRGGWSGGVNNTVKRGEAIRIQFSNKLSTPVDVRVTGRWRSN